MSCDGGATNSSKTSTAGESSPNTTTASVVLRSCLNLPSLPDSSLEDGKSGRYGKVEHTPRRSPQEKSPRESKCEDCFKGSTWTNVFQFYAML